MEPDLEFNIDDFEINEIVIDDQNIDTDNIFSIDDIDSNVNVLTFRDDPLTEEYESDDSDVTVAMKESCEDIELCHNEDVEADTVITDQLKDVTNLIELRQRKSAIIKIECPAENIEISKLIVPITIEHTTEDIQQNFTIPDEYYEGRILWCKLKSYPWWPGMIYHSPEKTFYKENYVHVIYFGPNAERGWIHVKYIFIYEGKSEYDKIVNKLKAEKAPKSILKNYCVTKSVTMWNKAWQEAETALSLNLHKRLRNHGMSYRDLTGETSESSESSENESESSIKEGDLTVVEHNVTVTEDAAYDKFLSTMIPEDTNERKYIGTPITGFIERLETITSNGTLDDQGHAIVFDVPISTASTKKKSISKQSFQHRETISDGISCSSRSSVKTSDIVLEVHDKFEDSVKIKETSKSRLVKIRKIKPKAKASLEYNRIKSSDTVSTCTPITVSKKMTLEYCNLKLPTFGSSKKVPVCLLCLTEPGGVENDVISCAGLCGHTFHIQCMTMLLEYVTSNESEKPVLNYQKCVDCNKNQRRCFMCRKLADKTKPNDIIKCNNHNCARYYHPDCLNNGIYHNLVTHNRNGAITCPSHTCHSCHLENPATVRHTSSHVRCLMCPASFHRGEWCIPAGSREINSSYIICPQHLTKGGTFDMWLAPFMDCIKNGSVCLDRLHFKITAFNVEENRDLWILEKPQKERKEKPFNVTWCFICSNGGDLICCEKCPASFHQQCAQITEVPERFVCEECHLGKYPRYGEIFWLKIGNYRWWPAQIIHPRNAPAKILDFPHGEGQFLVLFFGTNDYHWCNKTHAFTFDEGDDGSSTTTDSSNEDVAEATKDSRKVAIEKAYRQSLKIAGKVFRRRCTRWIEISGNGNKPSHYQRIKNNIPIGNVRITKQSKTNQCECRPGSGKNDRDPCGPNSDCINLTLMYECDPTICRNGSLCRNQRFMLRQYPRQEVFCTPDRGWALKIKESVKRGSFINEYVGEVIDEAEANRRLKTSHENNITNFYMMELDGGRIIDAGPAGNISRFMNHSCSPNVFTPKWMVNGDTRVGVFALHDIEEGDELTFNYNFLSLGKMKIPCKCGASNCSGFLGVSPKGPSSCDLQSLDQETQPKRSRKRVLTSKTVNLTERKTVKSKREESEDDPPAKRPKFGPEKDMKDLTCFLCKEQHCNLSCSFEDCPREYHSDCLELSETQKAVWLCPWHFCDDCGRLAETLCSFCTVSFCDLHLGDRIVPTGEGGPMVCPAHIEACRPPSHYPTESQTHSPSVTATDSPPSISI